MTTRISPYGKRTRSSLACWGILLAVVSVQSTACSQSAPEGMAGDAGKSRAAVTVDNLRCEYQVNPLGIDVVQPRLSWSLVSDQRGQKQTAYQIQVARSAEGLLAGQADLWDTGKVSSDQSIQVPYAGAPLTSGMETCWRVCIWDKDSRKSPWSEPARWTMGLLKPDDFTAKWIGLDEPAPEPADSRKDDLKQARWIWFPEGEPAKAAPAAMRFFRRTVDLPADRTIHQARFLLAADNGGTFFVNGNRVGVSNNFKAAIEMDVTQHLRPGRHVLAIAATNVGDAPNPAGVIGSLRVDFTQGDPLVIATDANWKTLDKEIAGSEKADFDDSSWSAARELGPCGTAPWGEVAAPVVENRSLPARMLRREFKLDGPVKRATAYICGLGYYELRLNGDKVGDHVLDPGLTNYDNRALYVTYDVTSQVKTGDNAIGVLLGNGRYFAPRVAYPFRTESYGYPKMLLQIHVEYTDGRTADLISDKTWKLTTDGPIRANNDYDGEEYDARMEQPGWDRPGFDDAKWQPARLVEPPGGVLAAQMAEPIRVTETITPVSMTNPQPGVYIYDLGQNIVGWAALTVQGSRGTKVTLRFAETLTREGQLFTANLRSVKATDIYVLKGQGVEQYEPRFAYHGFRYIELTGFPGTPTLETIRGRFVHSDLQRAGSFTCSNDTINRVYDNMNRGIRGNLRSIPTDCPQRDERHGWLGDIANESKAESFDFNVASFFTKWLTDIRDAQDDQGNIPDVAPPFWRMYNGDVTWPATYVVIPGLMYDQYGDRRLIEAHYPSMKKWIAFLEKSAENGIITKDMYGDWCVPPESPDLIHSKDPGRKTAGPLLATAYYCKLLRLVAGYADLLGRTDEARQFNERADRVAQTFNAKWFSADKGLYDNGTQTSSILPLAFGIVPEPHRRAVFDQLVANITEKTASHIGTGLVGGQWLMRTLSDNGRADLAYTIATQRTYPSWGYMVEKGATTIWELWNGDTADPAMNSHNHLMLTGDLGIWIYEYLAGIRSDPKCPGFKHIIMRPYPVGDLSFVRAAHQSLFGRIVSEWRIEGGRFLWNVTIPSNTTATVFVPASDPGKVLENDKPVAQAEGVKFLRMQDGQAVFTVESGSYRFAAPR